MRSHETPDAARHRNPDPARLRALVAQTGMTRPQLAARLGVGLRSVERWLGPKGGAPYLAQYAIESLAAAKPKPKPHPLAGKLGRFVKDG